MPLQNFKYNNSNFRAKCHVLGTNKVIIPLDLYCYLKINIGLSIFGIPTRHLEKIEMNLRDRKTTYECLEHCQYRPALILHNNVRVKFKLNSVL